MFFSAAARKEKSIICSCWGSRRGGVFCLLLLAGDLEQRLLPAGKGRLEQPGLLAVPWFAREAHSPGTVCVWHSYLCMLQNRAQLWTLWKAHSEEKISWVWAAHSPPAHAGRAPGHPLAPAGSLQMQPLYGDATGPYDQTLPFVTLNKLIISPILKVHATMI